jgi:hypothetical protein
MNEGVKDLKVQARSEGEAPFCEGTRRTTHMNVQRSLEDAFLGRRAEEAVLAAPAIVATPRSEYREVRVKIWSMVVGGRAISGLYTTPPSL